jgi:predicted RNA polymerase sigma factor
MIDESLRMFESSCTGPERSPFHVEAAIAVHHATESTDWPGIVALYDDLLAIRPSPVAALNGAIRAAPSHNQPGIRTIPRNVTAAVNFGEAD